MRIKLALWWLQRRPKKPKKQHYQANGPYFDMAHFVIYESNSPLKRML